MDKAKRPRVGNTITTQERIRLCSECGYALGDMGCDWECPLENLGPYRDEGYFVAIYDVTRTFVGDEYPLLEAA